MTLPKGLSWRPDAAPQHAPDKGKQAPAAAPKTAGPGSPGQEAGQPGTQTGTQPGAQGGPAPSPCGTDMMLMMGAMILVMWFLVIRPQQKQEKELRNMRDSLRKGDKVITGSGLHAEVVEVRENTVLVQADRAGDLQLTFERSAISRVIRDEGAEDAGAKA